MSMRGPGGLGARGRLLNDPQEIRVLLKIYSSEGWQHGSMAALAPGTGGVHMTSPTTTIGMTVDSSTEMRITTWSHSGFGDGNVASATDSTEDIQPTRPQGSCEKELR